MGNVREITSNSRFLSANLVQIAITLWFVQHLIWYIFCAKSCRDKTLRKGVQQNKFLPLAQLR